MAENVTNANINQFLDKAGLQKLWERITTEFAPRWMSYRPGTDNDRNPNGLPADEITADADKNSVNINFISAGILQVGDQKYGKDIVVHIPLVTPSDENDSTKGTAGLMSPDDKFKLDGLESTAENAVTIKGVKVKGETLIADSDKYVNWDIKFDDNTDSLQIIDLNAAAGNQVLTSVNVKEFISDALVEGFLHEASLVNSKPIEGGGATEGTFIKLVFKVENGNTDGETHSQFADIYIPVSDLIDIYEAGEGISITPKSGEGIGDNESVSTISLNAAKTNTLGGIKVKTAYAANSNVAVNTTVTNEKGRNFGVELDKDSIAFVNVPIDEITVSEGVNNTDTTIQTNKGGSFTFVTDAAPEVLKDGENIVGTNIKLTSQTITVTKETDITIGTPAAADTTSGGALGHGGTITVMSSLKADGTNNHTITPQYVTYTLPAKTVISDSTSTVEGANTETTLIANAETKVTTQVLKDISVVGDVIIKTYDTIDVFVTPITTDFINSLTLMTY